MSESNCRSHSKQRKQLANLNLSSAHQAHMASARKALPKHSHAGTAHSANHTKPGKQTMCRQAGNSPACAALAPQMRQHQRLHPPCPVPCGSGNWAAAAEAYANRPHCWVVNHALNHTTHMQCTPSAGTQQSVVTQKIGKPCIALPRPPLLQKPSASQNHLQPQATACTLGRKGIRQALKDPSKTPMPTWHCPHISTSPP
jgi:hypothetical protein